MSKVQIANNALAYVGVSASIVDFDKDDSAAGLAVRGFYNQTLKSSLSSFEWGFCQAYSNPAKIMDMPAGHKWRYAFQYPNDCLVVRDVLSNSESEPHETGFIDDARVIYCDGSEITVYYTKYVEDITLYPAYFQELLALNLAFKLTVPLSKSAKMHSSLHGMAAEQLDLAKKTDVKESKQKVTFKDSAYIDARK